LYPSSRLGAREDRADLGSATLDGLDEWRGHGFELAFQNEWAVGWLDGTPRVMTPDLICVLDSLGGEAIGTEVLRYGQRVAVIGMPVHDLMRTPAALEVVGPHAFGYPELTYVPLDAVAG